MPKFEICVIFLKFRIRFPPTLIPLSFFACLLFFFVSHLSYLVNFLVESIVPEINIIVSNFMTIIIISFFFSFQTVKEVPAPLNTFSLLISYYHCAPMFIFLLFLLSLNLCFLFSIFYSMLSHQAQIIYKPIAFGVNI